MELKNVIFDMDGVIFDSERLYIECNKEVAARHGITDMQLIEDVSKKCIGVTSTETRRIMRECLGEDFPLEAVWSEASKLFGEKADNGKLPVKPGVNEILQFLKDRGVRTAIASSTKTEIVKKELRNAGLIDYFDEIVGGDMIKRSKPEPDSFLTAAESLGVKAEECYIIEDSFNGIRAAKASGGFPIMVPDILQPDDEIKEKAGIILDSLLEVIKYFEQL